MPIRDGPISYRSVPKRLFSNRVEFLNPGSFYAPIHSENPVGNYISESWTRVKLHDMFTTVGITGERRHHWHAFRNYFIIRCLRKGVAVPAIMKWTGHDSASMVLHYAGVIREEDVYAEFRKVS